MRRDLVGGRRVRHQLAVRVPPQLLGGQPAHALDEGALHLADVDGRVQRLAGVVQRIGAQQLPFAGQRVDHALPSTPRRRRSSRTAGPAASSGPSAAWAWRRSRPDHSCTRASVGLRAPGRRTDMRSSPATTQVVAEAHLRRRRTPRLARGEGGQPLADLARRVLRGLAVQVGAGGGGRRRGVGHLAGIGGGHAHALQADAQLVRHHHAPPWCSGPGPSRCRRGSPAPSRRHRRAPARRPG